MKNILKCFQLNNSSKKYFKISYKYFSKRFSENLATLNQDNIINNTNKNIQTILQTDKSTDSNLNLNFTQSEPINILEKSNKDLETTTLNTEFLEQYFNQLHIILENCLFYENKQLVLNQLELFCCNLFTKIIKESNKDLQSKYYKQIQVFFDKLDTIEFKFIPAITLLYHSFLYSLNSITNQNLPFIKDYKYKAILDSEKDLILSKFDEAIQHRQPIPNNVKNLLQYLLDKFSNFFLLNSFELKHNSAILADFLISYEYFFREFVKSDETNMLLISTIDDFIDSYLSKNMDDMRLMNYLLTYFSQIKAEFKISCLIFPNINLTLCKAFILQPDIFADQEYLFNHLYFLKNYYKESFTNKHVNFGFMSNAFYLDDLIAEYPGKLKSVSTQLIIHMLYLFAFMNFKVNKNLILEVDTRITQILANFNKTQITTLVSGLALNDRSNKNLFRSIMSDPRLLNFSRKSFYNVGFFIAMSRFDDLELWKKWYNQAISYKNTNSFDKRMLKEIIHTLQLIGPKYSEFLKYQDSIVIYEKDNELKRWWQSKALGGQGLSELSILKGFDMLGIKYKKQVMIKDFFNVDFVLGDIVIVNINGPNHYWTNSKLELDIKTFTKSQVLRNLGYYVINIHVMSLVTTNSNSNISELILNLIKNEIPQDVFQKIMNNRNNS